MTRDSSISALEKLAATYQRAYESSPFLTNYASTAIGVVGGNALAKAIEASQVMNGADLAFGAVTTLYYSTVSPLILKIADKILPAAESSSNRRKMAKATLVAALFFPPNMAYWTAQSYQNRKPINTQTTAEGAAFLATLSAPYIPIDYYVANVAPRQYALPIWSAAEIAWNTGVALKNRFLKSK